MDGNQTVMWTTLLGTVLFTLWGALIGIAWGAYTSANYELTVSEKWLARTPAPILRWFSRQLPFDEGLEAANWKSLKSGHDTNLRRASKANDALFVVPWTFAVLVALCGVTQWAFVVVQVLVSRMLVTDFYLSAGIAFLSFIPLVATHEVRDSRWRARAPFEWQFMARALWLLDGSGGAGRGSQDSPSGLNTHLLWLVEETLVDRLDLSHRTTALSRKLAQETWHDGLRPLLQDAALLHLRPHGEVVHRVVHEWIEKAAALIIGGGSRKRMRFLPTRAEQDPVAPLTLPPQRHRRPSSAKTVIMTVVLLSAGSFILSWLSEIILNPQSLRESLVQIRANPAATVSIVIPTLAMLPGVGQFFVAYVSFIRAKRHT